MAHASPDFLIGSKDNADFAMGNFGVCNEIARHCHNGGDAGLVVGTQESCAAGGDNVLANFLVEKGIIGGRRICDGSSGKIIGSPL